LLRLPLLKEPLKLNEETFTKKLKREQPLIMPFIMDDLCVVDDKLLQIEIWLQHDKEGLQH
jgi:hypothetical protein